MNTPPAYTDFLQNKRIRAQSSGIDVKPETLHPMLFAFQKDITIWALHKGRAAIFADTGLGKTFMQVEWARILGVTTLIIAPLSVARQTVREARKINCDVRYVRSGDEVTADNRLYITNYEMAERFDPALFGAVVLDESSILKSLDGKTRKALTAMFADTPYRLACTATPAPNDRSEIGNHAEFLGICTMSEMLAMFFIHANKVIETEVNGKVFRRKLGNDKGTEWRLKHNAKDSFYQWLSSWAVSIRKPSDLGYDDNGYILPPLTIIPHWLESDYQPTDTLVFTGLKGFTDRRQVRRSTMAGRGAYAAELVNQSEEQWIVWTDLNDESAAMTAAIPGAVEVKGSDDAEYKAAMIEAFQDGQYRVMVTKPKIAGFGMNFQNAPNQVFVGLSDSWEQFYQAIRRSYRFGQTKPVNVHIVLTEIERGIYDNVMRKEAVAKEMSQQLIDSVRKYEEEELHVPTTSMAGGYPTATISTDAWTAMLGDSCERMQELTTDSIDLSVYSPPFADLYTYSNSERDLGNSRGWAEFFSHYDFIIRQLLRVTKPGRLTCVHVADIPAMIVKDGYLGLRDFPGAVIKAYEEAGWIFHGRVIVAKNPQAQAIRTKSKALLFVQLAKDSSESRPAVLDQILLFRKPGENAVAIMPVANGEMDNEKWIDWAGGIWLGIQESDTLQYQHARSESDEKHICPLQLGTIERCIKLYSNPGETVLTPFMGIGSEAYQAIRFGRKAIGIELKESYWQVAVQNLKDAELARNAPTLFDLEDVA